MEATPSFYDYLGQRKAQSFRQSIYCVLAERFGLPGDYASQAQFNYVWPEIKNIFEFTTSWGQDGFLIYIGPSIPPQVHLEPVYSHDAVHNAQHDINTLCQREL